MPTLTYTTNNSPRGGVLNSRVLIGKRLSHGAVLSEPGVSRLHAWIDPVAAEDAEWVVTDAGSKTGTFVNDRQITTYPLHDGDRIRVGKVTLTYHDSDVLPDDIQEVDLSAPAGTVRGDGILFECACGAPLWVGSELAGKRGMCRHCRKPVTVPAAEPEAPPEPKFKITTIKRAAKCAVCHSAIAEGEDAVQCPDCAMMFHVECWQENFGCSSYGCPQVDALKPREEPAPPVEADEAPVAEPAGASHRWDVILLAASVVVSLVGALAFGSLAAVVAVASLIVLIKGKQPRPFFLVLAIVISIAGIAAGLGVSDIWYFNARHIPPALLRK